MTKPKRLTRAELARHPLPPTIDGDKDSKGRVLVVAGSRQVPGAALLTATAAMRAGAGKLKIATVESIAPALGLAVLEAMVTGLAEDDEGGFAASAVGEIAELVGKVDAVVAGPGLAPGGACGRIAQMLVAADAPLALDAALLHALEPLQPTQRTCPPILLPHSGELAALLDCSEREIEQDPVGAGLRAAGLYRSVVLVKGVISHVVCPEGRVWQYRGGASGLGVSGSGDVLAGLVGGLLARGAEPLSALLWGVWLHGEAGARLAKTIGPVGFLAREIAGEVPGLLPV